MNGKTALALPDLRQPALLGTLLLLAAGLFVAGPSSSQEPLPIEVAPLDPADLGDLVAPIALYPDDVLAIVLPASTFPLDVVRAARFLDDLENDPSLEPDEEWDDSVVALLNYPEILRLMNEDIDWTWALGEAVLTDQAAVLAAAQSFRRQAYAAGNLQSDDRQTVVYAQDVIEIKPTSPEIIYVPVYEPREVIVYQPRPVIRYYPVSYPVYYYPYPAGYSFGIDYFWGVTSYFSLGWRTHHVHVVHHTHDLHPYYLHRYYLYTPYYPRSYVNVTVTVDNYANVWRPSPRRGARPQTVTVEGRSSSVRARTATVETQPGVSGGSISTRTTTSQRAAAPTDRSRTIGGVSQRSNAASAAATRPETRRAEITRTARRETTRPVESPAVTSSQLRGVRTRQATPAPATRQPATRPPTTRQPTTRPQTSAPRTITAPPSSSRSTITAQGSATRRAATPPVRSAPPVQSAPPARSAPAAPSGGQRTIGGTAQRSGPPAQSGTRTRRP